VKPFREAVKRGMDILACLALVPVALPLCAIFFLVIIMETPGAPLFVQPRVGRDGSTFHMFKLRTMLAETDDLPSHHVCTTRITRVGKVLRTLKLDELPQLLNVLSGAMSLVGPRPCLVTQIEVINARRKLGMLAYRPGITGPAQIAGVDMSQPERMARIEADYFLRANIWSDLRVLVATIAGRGSGDAAIKRL
jgi:O-antigen biosynthesis protein WbqP